MNRRLFLFFCGLSLFLAFCAGFFLEKNAFKLPDSKKWIIEEGMKEAPSEKWSWSLFEPTEAMWDPESRRWGLPEDWPQPVGLSYCGREKTLFDWQLEGYFEHEGEIFLCVKNGYNPHLKLFQEGADWDGNWWMGSFSQSSSLSPNSVPNITVTLFSKKDNSPLQMLLGELAWSPLGDTIWATSDGKTKKIPLGGEFSDEDHTVWEILDYQDHGVRLRSDGGIETTCYISKKQD